MVTAQWPSYAGRSPYSGRPVKRPRNTQVSSPVPGKGSLTLVGVGRRLDLLRCAHIGALEACAWPDPALRAACLEGEAPQLRFPIDSGPLRLVAPDIRLPGRHVRNRVVGVVSALLEGVVAFYCEGELARVDPAQYRVFSRRSWEMFPGLLHFSFPGYFS